jgi:hypothetical protein
MIDSRVSELGRIKIVNHADNRIWDINDVPFWLNIKKASAKVAPKAGFKARK